MRLVYLHNTEISHHTANLTQVISMCKAFAKVGLQVVLVLPQPIVSGKNGAISRIRENYNLQENIQVELINNPIKTRRVRKFTHQFYVKKILKKIKPDICYTRDIGFLTAAIECNIKSIYESHNYKIHNGSKVINGWLKKRLFKVAKNADFLFMVTISDMLKKHWIEEGFEDKIIVLHDGFIEEKYSMEISKHSARKKLGLPINETIIMYTGNLYPNRGIELVIELAKEFTEQLFVVVGGPKVYQDKLQEIVEKNGIANIIFVGQVPFSNIHYYQFAADINLGIWSKEVPTINYCSPLKIFEYLAVGRPMVAMGFPSIKEVLIDNKNAYVSDVDKFDDFKSKLSLAIKNLELNNIISKNARKCAFEKYTWTIRAKTIVSNII